MDESGGQGGRSKYYILTLVFHNQDESLADTLAAYRESLANRGLKDIPFHASPLMNGHDAYEGMDFKTRKSMFIAFFILLQHMPIRYRAFVYKRSEFADETAFVARMRRDIAVLLFDELDYLQSFDKIKIYYDGGQNIVEKSLREAVGYALSKESILYRETRAEDYRLAQAADMICALELTARKYKAHEQTSTDEKMFGSAGAFKNNYMKTLKRMRLGM